MLNFLSSTFKNPRFIFSIILFILPTLFYNNDTYLTELFYQVFGVFLLFQLASFCSLTSLSMSAPFFASALISSFFISTNTFILALLFSSFSLLHLFFHYYHSQWKSTTTIPLFQAVNFGLIASFGSNAINQPFAFSFFILYFLSFFFGWALHLKWLSLKIKHSSSESFKIPLNAKTALRFFHGFSLDALLFIFGGASLAQIMQILFNSPQPFLLLLVIPLGGLILRFFYSYTQQLNQPTSSYDSVFLDWVFLLLSALVTLSIPFLYFIFGLSF